jgi:hypothetical protein
MAPSYVLIAGLLTAGSPDTHGFSPRSEMLGFASTAKIKPGMTETQVERLLSEVPSGTIHIGGCGMAPPSKITMYIHIYSRSKIIVTYINGKVESVRD